MNLGLRRILFESGESPWRIAERMKEAVGLPPSWPTGVGLLQPEADAAIGTYHARSEAELILRREVGFPGPSGVTNALRLTIAFVAADADRSPLAFDLTLAAAWVGTLFPSLPAHSIWQFPALWEDARERGVHHFRVLCTDNWAPILFDREEAARARDALGWRSIDQPAAWSGPEQPLEA